EIEHDHRPERRAARRAEQARLREGIAQQALQRRAAESERPPDEKREQRTRHAYLEQDRPRERRVAEAERGAAARASDPDRSERRDRDERDQHDEGPGDRGIDPTTADRRSCGRRRLGEPSAGDHGASPSADASGSTARRMISTASRLSGSPQPKYAPGISIAVLCNATARSAGCASTAFASDGSSARYGVTIRSSAGVRSSVSTDRLPQRSRPCSAGTLPRPAS